MTAAVALLLAVLAVLAAAIAPTRLRRDATPPAATLHAIRVAASRRRHREIR